MMPAGEVAKGEMLRMASDVLLGKKRVLEMTGLSQTGLHDRIKRGLFPMPVKLGGGRAVGFSLLEVRGWIEARKSERQALAS